MVARNLARGNAKSWCISSGPAFLLLLGFNPRSVTK